MDRHSNAPTKVLLVEDDEMLRHSIARSLSKAGFVVTPTGTGGEALKACRDERPDVALIDVFLPDSGGLGVARELRRGLGSIPVLFMTGLSLPVVREALSPSPVLFKPFTRRQLLSLLRGVTAA
ncbi:MAG TPA: response regulator [Anaeromyxobacteraceae bacterium]|nr:response regulator [Anaeromyxobacteraceae bacterium]